MGLFRNFLLKYSYKIPVFKATKFIQFKPNQTSLFNK
jgi:hypothetical protein